MMEEKKVNDTKLDEFFNQYTNLPIISFNEITIRAKT